MPDLTDSRKSKRKKSKRDDSIFSDMVHSFQFGTTVNAKTAGMIQGLADKNKLSPSRVIRGIIEEYFKNDA